MDIQNFYRGKRVFITGHTGFKGAWLCQLLTYMGAEVIGYALPPEPESLFEIASLEKKVHSIEGDIRDLEQLRKAFETSRPEFVIHMAAQPIVRTGYRKPVCTYETNVMGTVNILECVRLVNTVKSFLNVTTDKVYQNNEWAWGYRETDKLGGADPYSNSKSCAELVTHSYAISFLEKHDTAISTARAGNVLGGGDFSVDRIIPDCVRAVRVGAPILVRNPSSIRPYQHVLDALYAYLYILAQQYEDCSLAGSYNVGPNECSYCQTGTLVDLFAEKWGDGASWIDAHEENAPCEANFLKLDCSKIKSVFGWYPHWDLEQTIEKTVEWTKCWLNGEDVQQCMNEQINKFITDKR